VEDVEAPATDEPSASEESEAAVSEPVDQVDPLSSEGEEPASESPLTEGLSENFGASPKMDSNESAELPTLDLNKPITVQGVQTLIDRVANEGGESGGIQLHLEGSAKVNAAIEAGAWADLGLNISKGDNESSVTLGLNTEVAAKLGFDLGIFNLEVAAGGMANVKARFQNSADAAAWFTENLHNINQKTGGTFQIGDSDFKYSKPTVIEEAGAFAQGSAGVEIPDRFKGQLTLRGEGLQQVFTTPDGEQHNGTRNAFKGEAEAELNVGRFKLNGSYKFEQSTQTGDPNADNNGTYRNHQLHFDMDYETLKKMTPDELKEMVTEMQRINNNDISLLAAPQLQKVIDSIQGQMAEIEKNPPSNGKFGTIGLTYEANNILEGGQYNNQYQRLFLTTEGGYRGQADLKVAKGEYSLSANKSERLWNRPGVNTESHAQQIFNGSRDANGDRAAWQQFKQDNPEALEQIARLHGQRNPNSEVHRLLERGDVNGAVQSMERSWDRSRVANLEVDRSARSLANYGNQWHLSNGEEAQMLKDIEKVYRENPRNLVKLFDRMESMDMTQDKLMGKTGGYFSTHDEQLQGYYNLYRQMKSHLERQAS